MLFPLNPLRKRSVTTIGDRGHGFSCAGLLFTGRLRDHDRSALKSVVIVGTESMEGAVSPATAPAAVQGPPSASPPRTTGCWLASAPL